MKILFLSFYFEPDLCAGSFRNTPLFKELLSQIEKDDYIHVITTQPNRYNSFKTNGEKLEKGANYEINRISIPEHNSGMFDQAKSFFVFYKEVRKLTKKKQFDLIYASSSRLFTAFLGRTISKRKNIPLYLDIRDIFTDTIKDILKEKKLLKLPISLFTENIERYTFSKANHINLVSEGFKPYFKKYPKPSYSYFTNGIDNEFITIEKTSSTSTESPLVITYAGNIGTGQGLEKIIPYAAQKLGNRYYFRVIGDGGTRNLLEKEVKDLAIENVEIIDPLPRNELIKHYQESTFLFLHLNNLKAFEKVLPSKLFEYGAFSKPIIAGVSGYAADFIQQNLTNYILFSPTDVDELVRKLGDYTPHFNKREEFIIEYSRQSIMRKMAESILSVPAH